jgi:hypothetical protein
MSMSEQQKSFRNKLREAGMDVRAVGPVDTELLRIDRPGKPVLFVLVNDRGEDGYSLWTLAPGIQIDDDIKLIGEAP